MGEWVIVTPPVVDFGEILQNKNRKAEIYEKRIKIQNIRSSAIKLNFKHTYSNFKIIDLDDQNVSIASGLSKTIIIQINSDVVALGPVDESVRFKVDNVKDVEIPVRARPSQPHLTVEGDLDFGRIIASNQVVKKILKLKNTGMLNLVFRVTIKNYDLSNPKVIDDES
jgi:hypothetical protein